MCFSGCNPQVRKCGTKMPYENGEPTIKELQLRDRGNERHRVKEAAKLCRRTERAFYLPKNRICPLCGNLKLNTHQWVVDMEIRCVYCLSCFRLHGKDSFTVSVAFVAKGIEPNIKEDFVSPHKALLKEKREYRRRTKKIPAHERHPQQIEYKDLEEDGRRRREQLEVERQSRVPLQKQELLPVKPVKPKSRTMLEAEARAERKKARLLAKQKKAQRIIEKAREERAYHLRQQARADHLKKVLAERAEEAARQAKEFQEFLMLLPEESRG